MWDTLSEWDTLATPLPTYTYTLFTSVSYNTVPEIPLTNIQYINPNGNAIRQPATKDQHSAVTMLNAHVDGSPAGAGCSLHADARRLACLAALESYFWFSWLVQARVTVIYTDTK